MNFRIKVIFHYVSTFGTPVWHMPHGIILLATPNSLLLLGFMLSCNTLSSSSSLPLPTLTRIYGAPSQLLQAT